MVAIELESKSIPSVENMPFLKLTESYIRYYASGQGHTARAKRKDLEHFTKFLANYRGYAKPEKLQVKDWDFSSVQRFMDECLQQGQSVATVNRRLATIKHMGRTFSEKVAGFVNPAREIKPPRIQAPCPKALTAEEIASIKDKASLRWSNKPSFIRFRNYAILSLLLDTGIRAEELRMLKRSQLDDKLEWLKSVRTKGRRYRNVYITSEMRPMLVDYLEARQRELKRFFPKISKASDNALPLFVSSYKAAADKPESFYLGAKTLWRAINELSTETDLHPHLLRHCYALELLNDSNDIRLVSQALGHSDVKITMRYTERKDEEVARALERARKAKREKKN